MKKHCGNCKYLDYIIPDYESNEAAGYFCNKRDYKNEREEEKHLDKLNSKTDYLIKSKRCHETREPDNYDDGDEFANEDE